MSDEQNDSRNGGGQSFFAKQEMIKAARTAFQQLSAIMRNATLYPGAHPFLLTSADKLRSNIEELLLGRQEVAFYIVRGELFFETLSVPIDQNLAILLEQFTEKDVGGILFRPGVTSPELIRFAGLMNHDTAYFAGQGGVIEAVENEDITHIELHRALLSDKKDEGDENEGKKKASEVFQEAIEAVKEMVQAVHLDKTARLRKVNTVVQGLVDNILDNRDALMGLTSLKMYDEYTFAHSVNTSILAISLGAYLSFDKNQISALGVAGLMHDIGKVSVPHEVINKPGKLTEEEWRLVMRHPVEGALLLSDIPGVSKLAMVAAFEHHQHGDAASYPKIEGQFQLHPFSQIVALADAYDALTAARVYYSVQMPPDNAVRILLKKRGTSFNAVLVKAFVNMIGIFPISTLLKLDNGEIGLVMHQTRDLMRPRVLLLDKFDGSEKETGEEISLLETVGGRYKRTIIGTINPSSKNIDVKQYLD